MKKLIDFDKEGFKKEVITNVKTLYRRPIEEATPQQLFQAVSYAVKDIVVDDWMATHKAYEKKDVKTVYYLSMEFLMGRALGNMIINLKEDKVVREVLDEMGVNLDLLEDEEPDVLGMVRLPSDTVDEHLPSNASTAVAAISLIVSKLKNSLTNWDNNPDDWVALRRAERLINPSELSCLTT